MPTGYVPKSRSPRLEAMPILLYLSSIAALVSGIGFMVFPPAILVIRMVIVGGLEASLAAGPKSHPALELALSFGFGAWCLVYRRALLDGARWFRAFALASLALPFSALVALGLSNGASLVRVATACLVFLGAPAWYLYGKRSVVAFFRDLPPPALGNVE